MSLARSNPARTCAAAGAFAVVIGAAFMPGDANAQQIFKIVGPDGRITFSDQPPLDPGTKASPAATVPMSTGGSSGLAGLPFELRQAAARYPVTIYTSPGCNTCAQGRSLLVTRGIPFTERTVATKEDGEALTRLTGSSNVPVLTIGAQQLRGYSDSEWSQFLDAAGYPKTSQLPPGYLPAPATPLVALDQRPAAAPAQQNSLQNGQQLPAQQQQRQPATPPADNPAGIQF
jgi:glutaredoxin